MEPVTASDAEADARCLLTTGESARLLGVTAQTVINWMETGKLPFVRVGRGRRKARASDLRALIEATGVPSRTLDPALWNLISGGDRTPTVSDQPMAVVDSQGVVVFWSPAAVERFGWTSSEVENSTVSKMPARVPGLPVDLAELAIQSGGDTFRALLLEMRSKAGRWIPVEVVVSWIHDARGQSCGAVLLLQQPSTTGSPVHPSRASKT